MKQYRFFAIISAFILLSHAFPALAGDSNQALVPVNEFETAIQKLEQSDMHARIDFFKEQIESSPEALVALVGYLESKAGTPEEREVLTAAIEQQKGIYNKEEGKALKRIWLMILGTAGGAYLGIAHNMPEILLSTFGLQFITGTYSFLPARRADKAEAQKKKLEERLESMSAASALLKSLDGALEELRLLPSGSREEFLEHFFFDRQLAAAAEKKALPSPTELSCNEIVKK